MSKGKKATIATLFALLLGPLTASADIVKGRVVDAETKEVLPEAQVECTSRVGDNGYAVTFAKTDSAGVFNIFVYGRSDIKVSMLGYYDRQKPLLALSGSKYPKEAAGV